MTQQISLPIEDKTIMRIKRLRGAIQDEQVQAEGQTEPTRIRVRRVKRQSADQFADLGTRGTGERITSPDYIPPGQPRPVTSESLASLEEAVARTPTRAGLAVGPPQGDRDRTQRESLMQEKAEEQTGLRREAQRVQPRPQTQPIPGQLTALEAQTRQLEQGKRPSKAAVIVDDILADVFTDPIRGLLPEGFGGFSPADKQAYQGRIRERVDELYRHQQEGGAMALLDAIGIGVAPAAGLPGVAMGIGSLRTDAELAARVLRSTGQRVPRILETIASEQGGAIRLGGEAGEDAISATVRSVNVSDEIALRQQTLRTGSSIDKTFARESLRVLEIAKAQGRQSFNMVDPAPRGMTLVEVGSEQWYVRSNLQGQRMLKAIEEARSRVTAAAVPTQAAAPVAEVPAVAVRTTTKSLQPPRGRVPTIRQEAAPIRSGGGVGEPPVAKLRLSIRQTERQGGGFLISGRDTKGRQVRVFAETLDEAKRARENMRQGLEAFPGTEQEAAAKAVTKAERKYRASLKRGGEGAIERSRVELEQAQARSVQAGNLPPSEPPRPPSRVTPGGEDVPMPEYESVRSKLVGILKGSVRRSQKEIEAARATERSRRAAIARGSTEQALAEGRSPLPGIRAAQRGELPVAELALSERLTTEEVAVLRDRIYKTLGRELDFTSANIEESLTRLATEGKLPTESELAWMEEIFGTELVEALRGLRTGGQKAREALLEIWNLPRAVLASFDDSMVLRQGLHLLPEGTPAGRALKAHVRAITKSGADEINEVIRANEWFNHGRAHGLDLTLPGLGKGIGGREEAFFGAGLGRRIPILGKGIEISERVATAYLNKLRMETYASHAQELRRMSAGFDAFKELADNINILSGRASLGRAQALAPYLNGIFFSARLNWARMQMPFRIFRQVPKLGTPEGRHLAKMLARDVYGMWGAIGGMVGLASAAGIATVELDPRSSDFGKMQIGSVRVDPWAGQQQFAVLMARLVTGERKTTTTRQEVPADAMETLTRFIESKFHPALSQLLTFQRGENFVGEELTVRSYAKQWLPLFVQDIGEIVDSTTPGMAAALGTAAFFGISVYNIPGVPATVLNQFQDAVDAYNAIPTDSLKLERGQPSRTEYRNRNPDADAALFLAGQVTSLQSTSAVQEVLRIIQENGINPDVISGIVERKERQQEAAEAGRRLERGEVDRLIALLEESQEQRQPEPTPEQPTQQPAGIRIRRVKRGTPTPEPVGAR